MNDVCKIGESGLFRMPWMIPVALVVAVVTIPVGLVIMAKIDHGQYGRTVD